MLELLLDVVLASPPPHTIRTKLMLSLLLTMRMLLLLQILIGLLVMVMMRLIGIMSRVVGWLLSSFLFLVLGAKGGEI